MAEKQKIEKANEEKVNKKVDREKIEKSKVEKAKVEKEDKVKEIKEKETKVEVPKDTIKIKNYNISSFVKIKQLPEFKVKAKTTCKAYKIGKDILITKGEFIARNYKFEIPNISLKGNGKFIRLELDNYGKILANPTNSKAIAESRAVLIPIK